MNNWTNSKGQYIKGPDMDKFDQMVNGHIFGYCRDRHCDNKEEKANLRLLNGNWVCDGCYEAILDNEDFNNANRGDMQEAGY